MSDVSLGSLLGIAVLLNIAACHSEHSSASCPAPRNTNQILHRSLNLDPHGIAPLSAELEVVLASPGELRLTLKGNHGAESDLVRSFATCAGQHTVSLLGLYPGQINEVELEIVNRGMATVTETLLAATDPLPTGFPAFEIERRYTTTAPSYFLMNFAPTLRPFIVDSFGEIRWYLDTQADVGLQVLRNGNIAFGIDNRVEEYSPLGERLNTWSVEPDFYEVHHDVFEMDNGNFLITANRTGVDTIEDFIIEIDRLSGEIVTTWDLRDVLPRRSTFIQDDHDWFHINAVIQDARDDSILVSGQRQGLVKLSRQNELRWILAPPDGWTSFEDYLLSPIPSSELEWSWGQHAPLLLPDGDILLFDNGFGRDYGRAALYSRAVRYRIAENADGGGTIEQIWSYGKQRGSDIYSPIISDVDYLAEDNTVLITSGSLAFEVNYVSAQDISFQWIQQPEKARIIEVDFDGNERFEMLVTSSLNTGSVYRSEKIEFFP